MGNDFYKLRLETNFKSEVSTLSHLVIGEEVVSKNEVMVSAKKVVLKNFANFLGKHLYWSLFLIKLQA